MVFSSQKIVKKCSVFDRFLNIMYCVMRCVSRVEEVDGQQYSQIETPEVKDRIVTIANNVRISVGGDGLPAFIAWGSI